jgi:large subunit ribosomal protein L15
MILNDIHRGVQKNRKPKRIGRGIGSGHGKTSGRGHKGAGSRAGFSMRPTFQGGQMSLVMRTPKRGFNNRWGQTVAVVNVGELNEAFKSGENITPEILVARNLAKGRFDQLKVLGDGEVTKKLNVTSHLFSQSAREKIEKAGGQVVVLPGKAPVGKQAVLAEKKTAKSKKQ